jgi:hypothetical protein
VWIVVAVAFKPTSNNFPLGCSERKLESRRKAAEEARKNAEEEQRREQPQLIRAKVC